jgi:hypothetical protein
MRRKTFIILMLVFSTFISISAQTGSGLEVSKPEFIYDVNARFKPKTGDPTLNNRAPFWTEVVQEISALFRNTGTKTVKKVSWQFIIYQNHARTEIRGIYNFKNSAEILPGSSLRLSKDGRFEKSSRFNEVNVFRVEYTDGTIWEGPKTKN